MRFIVEFDFINGKAMQLRFFRTETEAKFFIESEAMDGKIIEIIGGAI